MAASMAACSALQDSAGVQSLVDGIREEIMLAMLEGLQGTAAVCAEICVRRLEAQRREFLPVCEAETTMADSSIEQAKNVSTDYADAEEESLGASSWPSGVEGTPSADHAEHFCMDEDDDGAADSPAPDEQSQASEKGTEAEEERLVVADVADLDAWYAEEDDGAADSPAPDEQSQASEKGIEAEEERVVAADVADLDSWYGEASPAAEEPEAAATQAESAAPAQAAPEPAEAATTAAAQQEPESSDPSPADAIVGTSRVAEASPPEPSEHPGQEEDFGPGAAPDPPSVTELGPGALEHAADGAWTQLGAGDEAAAPRTPERRSRDGASSASPEKAPAEAVEGSRGEASGEAAAPAAAASTAGGPVAGGGDAKGSASTTRWLVVGGGDSKGITVRMGRELESATLSERLSTGSVIRQLRRVKDRVHYELEYGDGPATGWVSSKLGNGKVLLEKDYSAQPGLDREDKELQKKVPVAKTVEGRTGLQVVVVTEYWQQVPDGAACPQGCEFHCDMKTGKNHVRKTTT